MNTPDDLKYTAAHVWVQAASDGTLAVGITDHAQKELGDVVFVQPPAVGRNVAQGEECGVIESVKTAADLRAPVSGEVIAVNADAADRPERVNSDPYGTWLFRMKPRHPAELDALLDAMSYGKLIAENPH
jgi:glycine cleavage system H protein